MKKRLLWLLLLVLVLSLALTLTVAAAEKPLKIGYSMPAATAGYMARAIYWAKKGMADWQAKDKTIEFLYVNAENVTIHWTTDNWTTTQETSCQLQCTYWDQQFKSNARNPNQYGTQLWAGQINSGDAFRLQYIISCERDGRVLWDNNEGNNYSFQREQLKVLILNLHCYHIFRELKVKH